MREVFAQFDEAQLLALVEEQLDSKKKRALLTKLQAHPEALALIDQMRRDRTELQAVEAPEMPFDFLSQLEPMLSRPMLIEPSPTRPGEARRRHRRAVHKRQGIRFAAAAMLLLAVSGGIWASSGFISQGLQQLTAMFRSEAPSIPADRPRLAIADPSSSDADSTFSPTEGVLHHFHPQRVSIEQYAFADLTNDLPVDEDLTGGDPVRVAATLVLVVEAENESQVEMAMLDLVPKFRAEAAMVRNYLPKSSNRGIDEVPKSLTIKPTNGAITRQNAEVGGAVTGAANIGAYTPLKIGQAVGQREFTPSRQEQQRFADLGASYTFSVRSSRLADLLGAVERVEGFDTRLRFLSEHSTDDMIMADFSALQSLRQRSAIQRTLASLRARPGNPIVMLPVMVKQRAGN